MYNEYWILAFYVQNNNNVFITFPLSHILKKTIHNNFYNIIDMNSLKIKSMWITSAWLIKQDLEQETYKRKKEKKQRKRE